MVNRSSTCRFGRLGQAHYHVAYVLKLLVHKYPHYPHLSCHSPLWRLHDYKKVTTKNRLSIDMRVSSAGQDPVNSYTHIQRPLCVSRCLGTKSLGTCGGW